MSKDMLAQLKELQKNSTPRAEWKREQRAILMQQVNATAQTQIPQAWIIYTKDILFTDVAAFAKPAYSLALAVVLMIGGGFFSISAASEATPGSLLYTVKLVTEKTQMNLAQNREDKVKLGVRFAQRRVNELQGIIATQQYDQVGDVADTLSQQMSLVQDGLSAIEAQDPVRAAALAQDVGDTADQVRTALEETKKSAPQPAIAQLDQALQTVEKTSLRALTTIVSQATEAQVAPSKNVGDRVAAQLKSTKDRISKMEKSSEEGVFSAGFAKAAQGIQLHEISQEVTLKTQEAARIAEEARKLLEKNNYKEALDKITQSQQLISEAEAAARVREQGESQPATSTSSALPKEGEVRGEFQAAGLSSSTSDQQE